MQVSAMLSELELHTCKCPQAEFTPDANDIMRRGGDGLPSAAE